MRKVLFRCLFFLCMSFTRHVYDNVYNMITHDSSRNCLHCCVFFSCIIFGHTNLFFFLSSCHRSVIYIPMQINEWKSSELRQILFKYSNNVIWIQFGKWSCNEKKWAATLYAWTIELASFQLWQERVRLLPLPSRLNFHLNSTLFYQESSLFFSHAIWSIAHTRYPISHECLRFIDASMCNFISFDQVSTTSAFISPHFLSLSLSVFVCLSLSLCVAVIQPMLMPPIHPIAVAARMRLYQHVGSTRPVSIGCCTKPFYSEAWDGRNKCN